MSVKVMNHVFDRYPNGSGEMLLALALADHAHDDGTHIYPSIDHLATKTRQSVRSVQYQLRAMEAAGWLQLTNEGNGGRGMHREYRINPAWLKGADFASLKTVQSACQKGANCDDKGCKLLHPHITISKPSVNRQAAKGSRLPPEWILPKPWGEWALKEFPHWTADYVRTVATLFRNHWIAKSGKDATKVDWKATWENWCIKEESLRPFKNPNVPRAQVSGEWWKSNTAIDAKGVELGLKQDPDEIWPYWRNRVFIAAGEGPWLALLPTTRMHEVRPAGDLLPGPEQKATA